MRHHVSQNNFYDFAPQLISRADTHFAPPRCVFQGSANFGLCRNSVFRQGIQLAARYQKGSGNTDQSKVHRFTLQRSFRVVRHPVA